MKRAFLILCLLSGLYSWYRYAPSIQPVALTPPQPRERDHRLDNNDWHGVCMILDQPEPSLPSAPRLPRATARKVSTPCTTLEQRVLRARQITVRR